MGIIDLSLLEDLDKNDIEDLYNEYLENFKINKILNPGQKNKKKLNGEFDEEYWILKNSNTDTNVYIDFNKFERLKFKGLKNEDILIIKLWTAEMLTREDSLISTTIRKRVDTLYDVMEYTSCFNEEVLEQGHNPIDEWRDMSEYADKGICEGLRGVIEYLEYRIDYLGEFNEILEVYLRLVKRTYDKISIEGGTRKLPGSKDVTMFSYYLEKFFNENKNKNLEVFFYPVLIWWKVTNVIPMRTTELCKKITRECLVYDEENQRIFLKIDRVKKNRNPKKHSLPVLDKIEINKETADMIEHYIDITEKFGKTDTLFSYRAYNSIKEELEKDDNTMPVSHVTHNNSIKMDKDNFSSTIFYRVLELFYDYVIKGIYNDSTIETRIKPMDTRHFAFFSLMLQGLSPIEIALLGGHSTLKAQENYQYEVAYYVDSKLYELLEKNNTYLEGENKTYRDKIKKIIFGMPKEPPKNISECRELEVGFCTFDHSSEEDACEDMDDCCFCSKFWCYPGIDNYKKKIEMISNKVKSIIEGDLKKNTDFLSVLMNDIRLTPIGCRDDIDVCMDRNQLSQIRTTCNKIKHNTACINKLRYSMIELNELDGTLESVMKSISGVIEMRN